MTTPVEGTGPVEPTKYVTDASVAIAAMKKKVADQKTIAVQQKAAKAKAAAQKAAVKKKSTTKKKTSALDKYLAGDTTYQQQLAEFNAENSAYKTNYNRQNQVTNRDYNTSRRTANLGATQDRQDQQYDFAGRGILHSGVFAKALGDYNTEFNTKMNNLLQGKNDTLAGTKGDLNDFLRQLSLQKNSAKQDAVRRRSASLGL